MPEELDSLGDYIKSGCGDFMKPPDHEFAELFNAVEADPLPFKRLWRGDFKEKYSFPKDKLSPELTAALKTLSLS
jgi:hypothetical protein